LRALAGPADSAGILCIMHLKIAHLTNFFLGSNVISRNLHVEGV
jgi:hypothetical protein